MKDNLEKIIQKAQSANLRVEEKSSMRTSLLSKMNATPVRSPFWNFTFIRSYHYIPALLVVLFLIGGGTSYFAKNSLPGDALYPMKIGVNEKVESLFATTPESLAQVSAEQATRRVIEAETLAVSGTLTPEQNVQLQNNFSDDVDTLNTSLSKLDEDGATSSADEVRVKFDSDIEGHSSMLSTLARTSSTSTAGQILSFFKTKSHEGRGSITLMAAKVAATSSVKKDNSENQNNDRSIEKSSKEGNDDSGDDENENESGDDDRGGAANTTFVVTPPTATSSTTVVKSFSMAEVATHHSKASCYTTISGGVYDLTTWISQHPGGQAAILSLCGIDGTSAFLAQHSGQRDPAAELKTLKIGILK